VLIYTAILTVITLAVGISLAVRTPFKVDVVRDRATLARITEDGAIENIYRLQVMNASEKEKTFALSVEGLKDIRIATEPSVTVGPAEAHWMVVRVNVPYGTSESGSQKIQFNIQDEGSSDVLHEKSVFLVPR
jgi:polyferredoxin